MDSSAILIFGKAALTVLMLLGIPLWELYALRRDRRRGRPRIPDAETSAERPSVDAGRL